jgi:acyl-CoA synthetase (AMP-forming)/AMP-acid ligase II
MKRLRAVAHTLRDWLENGSAERFFSDRSARVCVNQLVGGTALGGRIAELAARSVLVATSSQLTAALALIELDGVARRLTILPSDTPAAHLATLISRAEVDAIVVDGDTPDCTEFNLPLRVSCAPVIAAQSKLSLQRLATEWVLLTSGTSGVPKMVAHSLESLTAPIEPGAPQNNPVVWGTFYDIRRYGGLQIFLRALVGGASLVLSNAGEPIADHLARLAQCGVTHLSGTPSHWRRALMSPAIREISPCYVRLSGEIADQIILDSLKAMFPDACVGHAYASTEAGVAFAVDDGVAGFPVSIIGRSRDGVEIKIVDGSMRIRSSRTASRYVGAEQGPLLDSEGFVDTGDIVELHGERYVFAGRKGGIINVGGQKVHPEEVEAVINRHPQVRISLVRPKRSPVTGAVVTAEVVLRDECRRPAGELEVKDDILAFCRAELPRYKVPAAITLVPSLDLASTGKLARRHG